MGQKICTDCHYCVLYPTTRRASMSIVNRESNYYCGIYTKNQYKDLVTGEIVGDIVSCSVMRGEEVSEGIVYKSRLCGRDGKFYRPKEATSGK